MARQVENDVDINRLNETTHYAGAADFERPRLLLPRRVSHTLPPPDAIVPYLVEAGFGDTVPLRNFIFDNSLISALVERWRPETHMWYHTETKESFTLKLVWLRDRVHQMPQTEDPESFRQYARCYIMLLIGGYLITDKSNKSGAPSAFFWGSAVLVWMYQSLSLAAQRDVTDINGCTPLLMSWIYQRFPQWCPPDRGVYQYPLATRLVRLPQQSRDQHEARVLRWRVSLDRLRFDEFAWKVYDDPALQALCPPWFREEEEWGTWLSAVPLLCFNIVRFHHVDRVKQQFIGE
ncbi:uncharacterized protein DS421_19g646920 [Arachis hypogaea]|uniref:Aminotransferase-like plant mobile domain-containing protein n=1 Tax=Arachis hypogaea TaxID=3818 RepID=A0A6B9V5X9_ARAHY|nr:uncharacterized protein DS421_19g646920 [Arachis hypogaea]